MNITVGIVITMVTLVVGEVVKLFNVNSKYIPLQNIAIAMLSAIFCIIFKVENMSILETIVTCIFSAMGAGGIYDLTKVSGKTE